MAFLVILIDSGHSVVDFNSIMGTDSTKARESISAASDYLKGIVVGAYPAGVSIISLNEDPSVSTDGGSSTSTSFSLK